MGRKKSKGNGEGTIYLDKTRKIYVGQYVVDGKMKKLEILKLDLIKYLFL